jgi:hypothetical protein
VDKLLHGDAARKYRVSTALVGVLVARGKRNRHFFEELRERENMVRHNKDLIKAKAMQLLQSEQVIDRASDVRHLVLQENGISVTDKTVRAVFRQEMGLKFRKIKLISHQANSERNLVLRQQFGLKMLELLAQKKNIINVDETWLSSTFFQRRKWKLPGTTNSMSEKLVNPRISLIAAIDTEGVTYVALTQVHTDV